MMRSPSRPATTANCAKRPTRIDGFVARTIARFCLKGKIAHDDLVCLTAGSCLAVIRHTVASTSLTREAMSTRSLRAVSASSTRFGPDRTMSDRR
jgi:hypothetical protein